MKIEHHVSLFYNSSKVANKILVAIHASSREERREAVRKAYLEPATPETHRTRCRCLNTLVSETRAAKKSARLDL